MGQILIRRISDQALEDFRQLARDNGTSLEAELRALIERNRPGARKDGGSLRDLAKSLQAMTPESGRCNDTTLLIRSDRDSQHGKWDDDGLTVNAGH